MMDTPPTIPTGVWWAAYQAGIAGVVLLLLLVGAYRVGNKMLDKWGAIEDDRTKRWGSSLDKLDATLMHLGEQLTHHSASLADRIEMAVRGAAERDAQFRIDIRDRCEAVERTVREDGKSTRRYIASAFRVPRDDHDEREEMPSDIAAPRVTTRHR